MNAIGFSTAMPLDTASITSSSDRTGLGDNNGFQDMLQAAGNLDTLSSSNVSEQPAKSKNDIAALKQVFAKFQEYLSSDEGKTALEQLQENTEGLDVNQLLDQIGKLLGGNADETLSNDEDNLLNDIAITDDALQKLQEELAQVLAALGQVFENRDEAVPENIKDLQQLLQVKNEAAQTAQTVNYQVANQTTSLNVSKLSDESKQLWQEISVQLESLQTNSDSKKSASEIMKLLAKWNAVGKQLQKATGSQDVQTNLLKTSGTDVTEIWKSLTDAYQRRTALVSKNAYNGDAKVTVTDVAKWVTHAMESSSQVSNAMPMSKIEQFVIHMNSTQNSQQQNTEFTTQFGRIIDASKFLQSGLGNRSLVISLNPGNLGEIMVKMQRINGELMVKLLVHSPEAKQLLESNLGQLKHMFSPHQVLVERQEQQVQTAQNAQQQQQTAKDGGKEQQSREQGQPTKQQDDSEEITFSEFLTNAEV